jgi:hypothetical protein
MSSTRCLPTLAVSLLLLLLLLSQRPVQGQTPSETQFKGEIQVREIGLVIEPPGSGPFKPADLLVFDGGEPRQVLKAEPLRPEPDKGSRPWTLVLYFDRALAAPGTLHNAALALARQARGLTGLGTVAVVVADNEPHAVLAQASDAADLSRALGRIAEQTQPPRGNGKNQPASRQPLDLTDLRRQLDRLTAFLAGRSGSGAKALFLVADGFVPPPGEADLISAPDTHPAPPGTATAAVREASRSLAASGWITFAMPFRDTVPTEEERARADMERIRVMSGGSDHTNSAPPVIPMRPSGSGPLRHASAADVFTRPESAPLMALVQPTAGTVLGVDEQLHAAVDGLARRWLVWYQAPETSGGKLRPVEVRLPGAADPLRSPRWVGGK